MKHPARLLDFDKLYYHLKMAVEQGYVRENISKNGLHLYCYTDACTYEKAWNETTSIARGLILDPKNRKVVATPFPKFFNVGEVAAETIPNLPFETLEKMDGSLIIIFHYNGDWRTATKGSLGSDQAKWAKQWLDNYPLESLDPGATYLAEAIYPENKIVVSYGGEKGLFLLGAYREDGSEFTYHELYELSGKLCWPIARRFTYSSLSELLTLAKTLGPNEEGFVLRFENGLRLKIKGDEYCRIHRLVSRLTPLAMWEALEAQSDLEEVRKQLPEEFWVDFDAITGVLKEKIKTIIERVGFWAEKFSAMSDKEVGLLLHTFPDDVKKFIFPYRKNKGDLLTGRQRSVLFREIRPTANILSGYTPSYAINRVMQEN